LDEWFVGMYRNYERLVEDKLPDVIHNCIQFMRSEAFFLILSNLTGLRLHRLAVTSPDTDEEDKEPSSADVGPGIDCTLPSRHWLLGRPQLSWLKTVQN